MDEEISHGKKDILECKKCNTYTFKETCPNCGEKTENVRPAKYKPSDNYAKYRRIAKERLEKQ